MWITGGKDMLLLLHAEVIQLCDHCPYECTLICYWGEPERAPHIREVHVVGLSVCRSVRTFMTQKSTRVVLIYGVPSVVDCSI